MLIMAFLGWWYGSGFKQVIGSFGRRLAGVNAAFSVPQLLPTLFSPWRRIVTYPGASLPERFRAWGDNLFSRAIGFVVRLFVLLGALVSLVAVAVLTTIEILAWPLVPLAVLLLIILGVIS